MEISDKLLDKISVDFESRRDALSIEYFGKPFIQLDIRDIQTINELTEDTLFPKWKPIFVDGLQTTYEISNTGLLRNTKTGNITSGTYNKNNKGTRGYPSFVMSLGGKKNFRTVRIHRAVAEAFIPNPENKPQVNHIDGIKHHNWYRNLEWVTMKENIHHSYDTHLRPLGEKNSLSKYTEDVVRFICRKLEEGMPFQKISKEYNLDYHLCANILHRDAWMYISKEYNIPWPEKRERFPDEMIHGICKRLQEGEGYADIANTIEDDRMTRSMVRAIAKGRCYRKISDQYDIPGLTKSIYLPPRSITEMVKRAFDNGVDINQTSKEIAKQVGMDPLNESDKALICLIRRNYKKENGIQ